MSFIYLCFAVFLATETVKTVIMLKLQRKCRGLLICRNCFMVFLLKFACWTFKSLNNDYGRNNVFNSYFVKYKSYESEFNGFNSKRPNPAGYVKVSKYILWLRFIFLQKSFPIVIFFANMTKEECYSNANHTHDLDRYKSTYLQNHRKTGCEKIPIYSLDG